MPMGWVDLEPHQIMPLTITKLAEGGLVQYFLSQSNALSEIYNILGVT